MSTFSLILLVGQALLMLFLLRFLLQSSSADYYHPLTQSVLKLTNPICNIDFIRRLHIKNFFVGGIAVAFALDLIFWVGLCLITNILPIKIALLMSVLTCVKCFGYLMLMILIVQALCSWLPSTRSISYLMYQMSAPFVAPVQKLIPPIGVIDISLMIVVLVIFALDSFFGSIFAPFWYII